MRQSLFFLGPRQVALKTQADKTLDVGEVRVQASLSAISPGTEMLVYRGELPEGIALDESIAALQQVQKYPLQYGYAMVGRVVEVGPGVEQSWNGQRVFAFHPHESCFVATTADLIAIPEDIQDEDAVFAPNMETAVNFLLDGKPLIGERVVVFGFGVVGLLTTALLREYPLAALVGIEKISQRRERAREMGVNTVLDPDEAEFSQQLSTALQDKGADLCYELTGKPMVLDSAIEAAGYAGRIVVGSWYGNKPVSLKLGGKYHRSRIQLISSQVSTIAPNLTGRWDKKRRFAIVWDQIRQVKPSRWISHRFPLEKCAEAYDLIDQHPDAALQVIFDYGLLGSLSG